MDKNVLAILCSLLTIGGAFAKIIYDYAILSSKVKQHAKDIEEIRDSVSDLIKSNIKTNETLIEVSTSLKLLFDNQKSQFQNIEEKIQDLKKDLEKMRHEKFTHQAK